MAIEGFIGLPGAGKTYEMTRRAVQYMDEGKIVFANYHIQNAWYFSKLEDLMTFLLCNELSDVVVLIDEISLIFHARFWQKMDAAMFFYFQQHRKMGVHMLYTTQSLSFLDTNIRQLTNWIHILKPLPFSFYQIQTVDGPTYLFESKRKIIPKRSFKRRKQRIYDSYNTEEFVQLDETVTKLIEDKRKKTSFALFTPAGRQLTVAEVLGPKLETVDEEINLFSGALEEPAPTAHTSAESS